MEFRGIYDQYYAKVRKFILTLVKDQWVADDLIQETFLRVQQSLGTLKNSSKTKGSTNLEQTEGLEEAFIQEVFIQKELEQREMGRCVQNQIDLLPEPLRTVLVPFDIMECSHQEIADILGITVKNAKVRLHRARKKLKPILEEKCTFERDERNVLVCNPIDHGLKEYQGCNEQEKGDEDYV